MSENTTGLKFDDTIHCRFYSLSQSSDLEQLCESINRAILSKSQGYVWNRDEFRVNIPLHQLENNGKIPHLISVTCFGDNIEDEWFIVHLIFELTRMFSDLIVHAEDSDGSFLLIEAADYLPPWLNPDNAENRVLIYQNNIHIITPELVKLENHLEICDAVKLVSYNCEKTNACIDIQNAIKKKISGYPQKIKDNMHMAIVSLPVEIAAILKLRPSIISPIVNSYCNLDALEAKNCRNIDYTNCVLTQIQFTKYLYAMLMHSKLIQKGRYNIPETDKRAQLGFKLTCGYNVIMKQNSKDIFNTLEYKKYMSNLSKTGYFKDNIEGSKEYTKLLEKAKSFFFSTECPMNTHIINEITHLKSDKLFEEIKQSIVKCDNSKLYEDDDDWLNICPDELNNILISNYDKSTKINNKDWDSPQNISSALTDFLKKSSDFEGIERIEDVEDNNIDFDAEQFTMCLEKFLNIATSNVDIELSEDSENYEDNDEICQEIEKELSSKLCSAPSNVDDKTVLDNLVQSMKEEGLSGPSSNVLKTIGICKTDLLDSDDDE
ncbi:protein ecdysoneless homolog [Zerene cesonia]|uniref:protein ecdysoneless homolog n=1 Tax=Zerene cesonia TaxID=33412 RepID=UPI0018E505E4|nr:protein ecdysoneless homolog [Zerene cesonia]